METPEDVVIDEHYLDDIPLFMDDLPKDWEKNETLVALESLKRPDTPKEQAEEFKSHGNEALGKKSEKDWKDAIALYTKALTIKCEDNKLNAVIFANRAMAHLKLRESLPSIFFYGWIDLDSVFISKRQLWQSDA